MKDKIPFYNIVNMFFVGAVFSMISVTLFEDRINIQQEHLTLAKDWSVIVSALLIIAMYEVGFIINRLSSIIVAPLLSKLKIWPKGKYDIDISEISQSYSKFQAMITELVLMRSHIMMYFILTAVAVILHRYMLSSIFMLLVIIFVLAGRKHNTKINIIRKSHAERYKTK